jgi:hypothetical protein
MFGKKGPVEYDLEKFSRMCQGLTGYEVLKRTIGTAKTTAIMLALHQNYHVVQPTMVATFPQTINDMFMAEADQIRNKKAYVSSLLDQANAGRLRQRLDSQTEPVANYSTISGGGADGTPGGEVRNLGLAYDWVAKSWIGPGRESIMGALAHYAKNTSAGPPLGYDTVAVEDLFRRVVKTDRPFRGPNPSAKYPSSFGGKHLLEEIFKSTGAVRWPARGHEHWDDYALFYLGSIVTVQAFPDGNKRVGKMAYAITLIKGGRPFRAPVLRLENELYRMS